MTQLTRAQTDMLDALRHGEDLTFAVVRDNPELSLKSTKAYAQRLRKLRNVARAYFASGPRHFRDARREQRLRRLLPRMRRETPDFIPDEDAALVVSSALRDIERET